MTTKTLTEERAQLLQSTATRYAVETAMLDTWENCWTDNEGLPLTFATFEEAEQEMEDYITDCINAVEGGEMEDSPDPSNLRVVAVAPCAGKQGAT